MVGCSVFGCNTNTGRRETDEAGVTFHAFPTEVEIRKNWMAVTGIKNWVPNKNSRICSKHFEQHCFHKTQKQTFIKKFSIPTLFVHKFPVYEEVRVESLPTESMESQSQPDTHAQQNVESKSVSKLPVSQEVRVELLPTEFVDCQSQPDTQAQQHSVEAKSIECPKSSNKSMPRTEDLVLTNSKLTLKLNRQTLLAESRRKKIEALRSHNRRLQKKNAELSEIIKKYKNQNIQKSGVLATLNQNDSE